ncbi:MAG TPA: hypothetical protein VLE99_00075 [Candidatus Saccharimonadales bacterium]|nr:hypothetical protein [Candidatus Saccharimonadales bacterium]
MGNFSSEARSFAERPLIVFEDCFPVTDPALEALFESLGRDEQAAVRAHCRAAELMYANNPNVFGRVSMLNRRWRLTEPEQRLFSGGAEVAYYLLELQADTRRARLPRVRGQTARELMLRLSDGSFDGALAYAEGRVEQLCGPTPGAGLPAGEDGTFYGLMEEAWRDLPPAAQSFFTVGAILTYDLVKHEALEREWEHWGRYLNAETALGA